MMTADLDRLLFIGFLEICISDIWRHSEDIVVGCIFDHDFYLRREAEDQEEDGKRLRVARAQPPTSNRRADSSLPGNGE